MGLGTSEDTRQLVAIHRGVIKEENVVGALNRDRKILKAADIASAYIDLGNIVTARPDTFGNPREVDLDAFGPDVDENDLKASANSPCVLHQLEVALARKRRLHREAFSPLDVLFR